MKTYLSGIQPSGRLHLGNYFGAIRQHIALQEQPGEHYYFIADYHAMTTVREPERLRELVRDVAATYLALGLDPQKAVLWRQSDVPEVCELSWMLSTVTGMGLLERAHSYKDKLANGFKPSVGLFAYPVLMAADILAYDATHVPVGKDQVQHLEMTQDMAGYFNGAYGEVFVRPEALLADNEAMAKVPGLDGQKMSKSYGNDVWIFEEGKALKKAVGRIPTDSRPPEEPKEPRELLLFDFLGLFLGPDELADWEARVRRGGPDAPGYGHLKARLIAAIDECFGPARERRKQLLADPTEIDRVLALGAEKAGPRARATRDRALLACGLR
ncbi:MAG: tryptophan--tRNA ligase [Planctomycetes bacterium]|nr:tryptophan--tRNA ligase [Planctomycetota bacterium]MCB9910324.1 tryptophan--tRNA ligase [Planctomycetota bacterium]MCB9912065.1 tryptophan--tRNA ligase [Planctomycetota bacterium]HRV82219.1 tryptophan--tRNA ligase [Planctomycetota bacterium]